MVLSEHACHFAGLHGFICLNQGNSRLLGVNVQLLWAINKDGQPMATPPCNLSRKKLGLPVP
jgi:hypothetical protein